MVAVFRIFQRTSSSPPPLILPLCVLLLCLFRPAQADETGIHIKCEPISHIRSGDTLTVKRNVEYTLTALNQAGDQVEADWSIEYNEWLDAGGNPKKTGGKSVDVVEFQPAINSRSQMFTGIHLADQNRPIPPKMPRITAKLRSDLTKSAFVDLYIVDKATTFIPVKITGDSGKQELPRKGERYVLTVPMDGTIILRGTAFEMVSGKSSALDAAAESWSVGDDSVITLSSKETHLEKGALQCYNTTQVTVKPKKFGVTSIRISNDPAIVPSDANAPSVEIAVVVTGGPTSLTLSPDTVLSMNHRQVTSIHALVQDAMGAEVPVSVTWKITDTSIVNFTDAPDTNTTAVSANSDPSAFQYIKALKPGNTLITATVPGPNGTQLTQKILVTVLPVLDSVVIESPGSLLAGQESRLQIRLLNSNGDLVNDAKLHVPVVSSDEYINARLDPQDNTGHLLLVRGIKPGDGLLTLKYKNENGDEVKSSVGIHVVTVAAFRPVRVSLDIMDEETAAHLFGNHTSKEFYVVRVRLFNNLDQLGAQFLGQSILAYSESIEAAVRLEKRYDPKSKTRVAKSEQTSDWREVSPTDVEGAFHREFENGDNTASVDKRFRGKPKVTFLQPDPVKNSDGKPNYTISLNIGEVLSLSEPLSKITKDVNVAKLLWKSANPSIASVNADTGLVVGREPGLTFIRGSDIHDQEYVAIIQVKEGRQETPSIYPNVTARILPNLTLDVGQSAALTPWDDSNRASADFTSSDLPDNSALWRKAIKELLPESAFVVSVGKLKTSLEKSLKITKKKGEPARIKRFRKALVILTNFKNGSAQEDEVTREVILNALNGLLDSDLYSIVERKLLPAPYSTYTSQQFARLGENPESTRRLNRALLVKVFPKYLKPSEDGDLQWISLTEAVAAVVPQDGSTKINSNIVTAKYPGTALLIAKRGNDVVYGMQIDVNQPRTNDLPPNVFVDDQGNLHYMRHRFRYRPYAFEMMVNTIEARDELEPRTRTFKFANAIATIASFFTSTGVWHGGRGSDLVNGFSNIILPGFEKLYPSMKDTQRQNFVSMSMKPLEEIPFGADIARVLFFPKHPFHGIIPGYEVRIGEVVTSEFNVKVAIIDKTKAATVNAAGP